MEGGQKLGGWQQHLVGGAVTHSLGKDISALCDITKGQIPRCFGWRKLKRKKEMDGDRQRLLLEKEFQYFLTS